MRQGCHIDRAASIATLRLEGELDWAFAQELGTVLGHVGREPNVRTIEVDLGAVTFMDCTIIGVLVAAQTAAHRAGQQLRILRPTGIVRRVLEATGTLNRLSRHRTVQPPSPRSRRRAAVHHSTHPAGNRPPPSS